VTCTGRVDVREPLEDAFMQLPGPPARPRLPRAPPKRSPSWRRLAEACWSKPAVGGRVLRQVTDAIEILADHPLIGRRVEAVARVGDSARRSGYLALYRIDPVAGHVRLLRIRHQREVGYRD